MFLSNIRKKIHLIIPQKLYSQQDILIFEADFPGVPAYPKCTKCIQEQWSFAN